MKPDTHEFPLRIGLETAAALKRYQMKYDMETMEEAAKSCLRDFLANHGFVEFEHEELQAAAPIR